MVAVLTDKARFALASTKNGRPDAPREIESLSLSDDARSRQLQDIQTTKTGQLTRTGTDVAASAIFLQVRRLACQPCMPRAIACASSKRACDPTGQEVRRVASVRIAAEVSQSVSRVVLELRERAIARGRSCNRGSCPLAEGDGSQAA